MAMTAAGLMMAANSLKDLQIQFQRGEGIHHLMLLKQAPPPPSPPASLPVKWTEGQVALGNPNRLAVQDSHLVANPGHPLWDFSGLAILGQGQVLLLQEEIHLLVTQEGADSKAEAGSQSGIFQEGHLAMEMDLVTIKVTEVNQEGQLRGQVQISGERWEIIVRYAGREITRQSTGVRIW
jgi:hypothetical protein